MATRLTRRELLCDFGYAGVASILPGGFGAWAAEHGVRLGRATPFSFESLVKRAMAMAAENYSPPDRPAPDVVEQLDYEAHGKIRFRRDVAPFADGSGVFPITFFHPGKYAPARVRMHIVDGDHAREVLFSRDYFEIPRDSPARSMPADAGFAGFRIHESRNRDDWRNQDWAAFLGASYFRAIGAQGQYGLSARGLAVDTAQPAGEEFPDFRAFYIAPSTDEREPVTVCALLDGASVVGAYRFTLRRTAGVVMDVDARVFMRRSVSMIGFAPLTSMFWYDERNRPYKVDWRPEIHDSDGLALWTGNGERIWRPLNNPDVVRTSSFLDRTPRGFGLMQRDRAFDHYLDGVHYERRPNLWVEPLHDWGSGSVRLVEIPTDDEIHDNIVAAWVPSVAAERGETFEFSYRLHWLSHHPYPPRHLGRVVSSRTGRGGQAGTERPEGVTKHAVSFEGGALTELGPYDEPEVVVTASRGVISLIRVERLPEVSRWRVTFDIELDGGAPAELRLYLALDGRALTETWLHQHLPTQVPDAL